MNKIVFILIIIFSSSAFSKISTYIVDVGSGLCSITNYNGIYIIYDAGHFRNKFCYQKIIDLEPENNNIKYLFISHLDSDHIGNASQILDNFNVANIIEPGYRRDNIGVWRDFNKSLANSVLNGSSVIRLSNESTPFIREFSIDDLTIKALYGESIWNGDSLSLSERRNASSIVLKYEYKGKSILFTGDIIGLHSNSDCSITEKWLVNNNSAELKSDILIVPHHGSSSASSDCFLDRVEPKYIVFPSGHKYAHPRKESAERILKHTSIENVFRTDRGDDEGYKEWDYDRIRGCRDKAGDDDININIDDNGNINIFYENPINTC